jgi:hypothetical protein
MLAAGPTASCFSGRRSTRTVTAIDGSFVSRTSLLTTIHNFASASILTRSHLIKESGQKL